MEPAEAFDYVMRELKIEAELSRERLGFEADIRRTFVICAGTDADCLNAVMRQTHK